jgi:hypothetical protein
MPRYFFHLRDGVDILLDPDGRELPDAAAAAQLALTEARSLMSHEILGGVLHLSQRLDVEDSEGRVVHSLAFSDAVSILGDP